MNPLEVREKEIFEMLRNIKDQNFILIGGYAVNSYTLPRFSVDCDIVVKHSASLERIRTKLSSLGYVQKEEGETSAAYSGEFIRYEKALEKGFKVSVDILVNAVVDRRSDVGFSASWVFDNASVCLLRGKTIREEIYLSIVNPDALVAMKTLSCRTTDIRDIFMLIVHVNDFHWIREEVEKRADFKERAEKIKEKISSLSFKNNLQGVYGFIDEQIFEKHKKKIIEFCQ